MNGFDSLAIKLLKDNWDVWIGNNRGNIYSRYHTRISPESDARNFYDYSFYEMGKYDVPAMVDGILEITHEKQLTYAGYDLGATQMFTALAYNFNSIQYKIWHFVALAPVVNLDHATDKFYRALSKTCDTIRDIDLD